MACVIATGAAYRHFTPLIEVYIKYWSYLNNLNSNNSREADPLQRLIVPFEEVDENSTEESEEEYESADASINNEEGDAIERFVCTSSEIIDIYNPAQNWQQFKK